MRYKIEPLELCSLPDQEDITYQLRDVNSGNIIMHNDPYYNHALNKASAVKFVQACNNFPKAVEWLKYIVATVKLSPYDNLEDDINEFLKQLEDEK